MLQDNDKITQFSTRSNLLLQILIGFSQMVSNKRIFLQKSSITLEIT